MTGAVQVTTTLPDRAAAEAVGTALVDERLAACAQILGPVTSVYWWEGRRQTATEWYCHLKTTAERLPDLEARLRALHPYDTPEIIALPVVAGHPAYLEWVRETVRAR